MKRCTACGETKPLDAFTPDKRRPDGRYARCRPCFNAAARERAAAAPRRTPEERTVACVGCGAVLRFTVGAKGGRPPKRCAQCRLDEARAATRAAHAKSRADRLEYMRRRKQQRKTLLDAYKVDHGCIDCGTREGKLELDHRPGEAKRFNPSHGIGYSLEVMWAEVAKCDVRCSVCHRKRHARQRAQGLAALHRELAEARERIAALETERGALVTAAT